MNENPAFHINNYSFQFRFKQRWAKDFSKEGATLAWGISQIDFYRPHPKDGEGTVLTGVCLSVPGGYPRTGVSPARTGLGYHQLRLGYPPGRTGPGYNPQPGQDWGHPPPSQNSRAKTCLVEAVCLLH